MNIRYRKNGERFKRDGLQDLEIIMSNGNRIKVSETDRDIRTLLTLEPNFRQLVEIDMTQNRKRIHLVEPILEEHIGRTK